MKVHKVCSKKPKKTEWGFLEVAATLNSWACLFQLYKTIAVQTWIDNTSLS